MEHHVGVTACPCLFQPSHNASRHSVYHDVVFTVECVICDVTSVIIPGIKLGKVCFCNQTRYSRNVLPKRTGLYQIPLV